MTVCFIALGSNMGDSVAHLNNAITEIAALSNTSVTGKSKFYSSNPVGPQDQPDFVNAVIEVETERAALDLLDQLQAIEKAHDKVKQYHWGPRTLDLDMLTYGNQSIDNDRLTVPHPFMLERGFVLKPLSDINDMATFKGKSVKQWLALIDCSDLKVIASSKSDA
jgi:2-amino-4-hydroxy-6-hydroxymethyldihydropteridine diphosphokinase